MKVIDATDAIAGRLASTVAKMAMQGETVRIVNCEKAIISGDRKAVIKEYTHDIQRGHPLSGPYVPRRADMLLRRIIRGMIPYRKEPGRKAFARIKTFLGLPDEFKGKTEVIKEVLLSNTNIIKFITLGELSKRIGAKDRAGGGQ